MTLIKISGGTVIDPAKQVTATVRDIWIESGRIVATPGDGRASRSIDATGLVVMPGGVDMHSHFVGPKVNLARQLNARTEFLPHDADRTRPFVPALSETGLRYAGLGYTTAIDAAVPPLYARQAGMEIAHLPCIDAGFLTLVGNHRYMLQAVADQDHSRVEQFLASVIQSTGAWGAKVVNPGGVEDFKSGFRDGVDSIDQTLHAINTTPRDIIQSLARANDQLELPHAIHIHCNRLGLPGNWQTTLATMQTLGDARGHLAHVQFHSYRGADDEASFGSAVDPLVEYVNTHSNISVDVGQIMFGETMSMTADSPLGYYLQKITGRPWISHDTEQECGCGISPIRYRRKDRIHGLQWAIGLEWFLRVENPWQIALSTDHPNGASFLAYPQIIALLMDRDLRRQQIEGLHDGVRQHSTLFDIDREYTLDEIAIITRSAPARLLGLMSKGHLAPGGDADITIYQPDDDRQKMFEFPRYVIKVGEVIVDDGELLATPAARWQSCELSHLPDASDFEEWSRKNYSIF